MYSGNISMGRLNDFQQSSRAISACFIPRLPARCVCVCVCVCFLPYSFAFLFPLSSKCSLRFLPQLRKVILRQICPRPSCWIAPMLSFQTGLSNWRQFFIHHTNSDLSISLHSSRRFTTTTRLFSKPFIC